MKRFRLLAPALLVVPLLLLGCGDGEDDGEPTPAVAFDATEVLRQVLAATEPDTAEGQVLELTRAIIPAEQGIPPHTHPGPQLSVIVSGTLTYTVIDGEATVSRSAATEGEEVETVTSGQEIELRMGDVIHEPAEMVHEAANETDQPVVIYISSLFPEGDPPATTTE